MRALWGPANCFNSPSVLPPSMGKPTSAANLHLVEIPYTSPPFRSPPSPVVWVQAVGFLSYCLCSAVSKGQAVVGGKRVGTHVGGEVGAVPCHEGGGTLGGQLP